MFKHILVPVDLGDVGAAGKAMATARQIASVDGARLSLVSVVPPWPDEAGAVRPDWQARLDAYLSGLGAGPAVEGSVLVGGSVSGRILDAVEQRQVDLVVMASHDPRTTDYVIGSNAAHVVLHAPCSVLVVR